VGGRAADYVFFLSVHISFPDVMMDGTFRITCCQFNDMKCSSTLSK